MADKYLKLAAADPAGQLPLVETVRSSPGGFIDSLRDQAMHMLELGGPVVGILTVMSVLALAIILLKWWQFAMLQLNAREPVSGALAQWREGRLDVAEQMLATAKQPVARLVGLAMSGLRKPGIDTAVVREELTRVASVELEKLRSYLRALEVIATLSPLLGLLGTVLGMIEAFQQLQAAGTQVDPAVLSGGIWQALLTTALGLSVAIPAVLAHTWLERKIERYGHFMEDAVTQVFTRNLQPSPPAPTADKPQGGLANSPYIARRSVASF